ncbi:hypothetical protein LUZ60_014037 [Juncus effusus]|nr:hypothetical protein LUZ60_014037 [Juncus effusus]
MDEKMGRRTVGGLILTRAGSILVFRDEKENPNSHKRNTEPSRKSKNNPEPSRRNTTTNSGVNSNKNKRDQSENLTSRINRRVSSSITRTVSQIQGSLRGKTANSSESGNSSNNSSTNISRVKRKEGDRIGCGKGRCGQLRGEGFRVRSLTPNERRNGTGIGISRFSEGLSANLSRGSSEEEDDARYWHFNIDDSSERFLEQESNSFLDDSSWPDRHREMRMDIDDMSYEELVAFCERIGTVNTGLSDASLSECIKKSLYVHISSNISTLDKEEGDIKCIICQEEYSFGEETGKITCGHFYHINCINQWLRLKNWCPICKAIASSSP